MSVRPPASLRRVLQRALLPFALTSWISQALANNVALECLGNIETFDRQVLTAGVRYHLSYEIAGTSGAVRVAGREFTVTVERGSSWKGPWLKLMAEKDYLSFLPEDGGTLKLQFETNAWFSGNCR